MNCLARLVGRIVSAEARIGLPYVLVQVDGLSTSSGLDGSFSIDVPSGRTYSFKVRTLLYKPVTQPINVAEERTYDLGEIQMILAIFGGIGIPR